MLIASLSSSPAEVIPTDKVEVGFKDIDAAILVGSMPRKEGMERKDLLKANVAIFKTQGSALDKYAKKTVKVTLQPPFDFIIIRSVGVLVRKHCARRLKAAGDFSRAVLFRTRK